MAGIQPNLVPLIHTQLISQSIDTRLYTSKYSIYCKTPNVVAKKENGQLMFRSSELLSGLRQRVLKVFVKGKGCR